MKRIKKEVVIEEEEQQPQVQSEQNIVIPQLPSELMQVILEKLDRNDLLKCRQLNSYWKSNSDVILGQKNLTKIVLFKMKGERRSPYLVTADGFLNTELTLDSLNSTLTNAKNLGWLDHFPCTSFELQELDLSMSKLSTFFSVYGSQINRLDFTQHCHSPIDNEESYTSLPKLLDQCPNLAHLVIDKYCEKYMPRIEGRSFPLTSPLTRLKRLECENSDIVEGILDGAINLVSFTGMQWYNPDNEIKGFINFDKFVNSNKIHTIQDLNVEALDHNISFYEEFANFQPKLKILKFDWWDVEDDTMSRFGSVLTKLLESSKDTLEVIDLNPYCMKIKDSVKIPRLSKLTQLGLDLTEGHVRIQNFHDSLTDPWNTFPNLKEVSIDCYDDNDADPPVWDDLFPADLQLPEFRPVTTFSYYCYGQRTIVPDPVLTRVFPNLAHFTMKGIEEFDVTTLCRGIWDHMKNLETLDLEDIIVTSDSPNRFPALDSALTGFDPSTCSTLADHLESGTEAEFWVDKSAAELRTSSSILEMTRLKRCTIRIRDGRGRMTRPISLVSIVYALHLMPQLQLSLIVEVENSKRLAVAKDVLAPVIPHLTSVKFIQGLY